MTVTDIMIDPTNRIKIIETDKDGTKYYYPKLDDIYLADKRGLPRRFRSKATAIQAALIEKHDFDIGGIN